MMNIKNEISNIQSSAIGDPRWKQDTTIEITDKAREGVDKLFASILPHFPAWRQTCKNNQELGSMKLAWTKAFIRNKAKTGKNLNLKAGILACEESDSDWLPSVGKFIKWCDQDDGLSDFADRAYDLFVNREKQIDSVGLMVTSKYSFELRQKKASECESKFKGLYLKFASNNEIKPLDAFAITETVQLTPKQEKEAKNRAMKAQNQFLSTFSVLVKKNKGNKEAPPKNKGIHTGKIKSGSYKSPAQMEAEKQRQLAMIKELKNV